MSGDIPDGHHVVVQPFSKTNAGIKPFGEDVGDRAVDAGHVSSKREWIAELRSSRFVYETIEPKGASVAMKDGEAVLTRRAIFTVQDARAPRRLPPPIHRNLRPEGRHMETP